MKNIIIALFCLFSGGIISFAQTDTTLFSEGDTVVFMPRYKFDFGTPNPHADQSKLQQHVDALNTESYNTPAEYAVMMSSGEDVEYAVGQISYQEDITAYGGRIYNVPIMVSPMSDLPPQISLQYNSQAGNGLAGYGWNIGGLSSIMISNKNLYYNGEVAPIELDDTDAFYTLDGVPLVQNDDPDLISEYPLETSKGHILVKKHISSDNIVSHFTVLYPDGSNATFGMATNTSAKTVYPITFLEDRLGNQIVYDYDYQNSDYRVSSVRFKHKNNSSYVGELNFNYTIRTDYHIRYRAGQQTYQNYILKSITSISNGSTLCVYDLTHELKDGANLLISIGCTNSSGEQLRPLSFNYGSENYSDYNTTKDIIKKDNLFLSTYFSTTEGTEFIYNRGKYLSDRYQDGLMILPDLSNYDIIATKTSGSLWWEEKHYLFGSTYAPDQTVLVAPRLTYCGNVDNSITVGEGFQCINPVDIDGDGVDEIVKVNFNGTSTSTSTTTLKITVYSCDYLTGSVSQEKTFNVTVNGIVIDDDLVSPMPRSYYFGDFRGDGKSQLLTISYNEDPFQNAKTSYASLIDIDSGYEISESDILSLESNKELFCLDLDCDGKTEICHLTSSGLDVYNLNGTSFTLTKTVSGITASALASSDYHLTDINGDGYVDVAREPKEISPTYWYFYQFNGESFVLNVNHLQELQESDKYMFFDINNDGLSDIIQRNGTAVYIYLNEKGSYSSNNRISSSSSFSENTKFIPCNISGYYNSMSDFITVEDYYVNLYKFSQDLSAERLLTRFTNSLGGITVNSYENMAASDDVYQVDVNRTYSIANGFAKCRFPLYLLSNSQSYLSSSQTESSTLTNTYYTYFDACNHSGGLGFCGFGKVMSVNFRNITNKELVTIEIRDPERMGVTTRLENSHRMSPDTPYNITEYTYDAHTTTYGRLNPRVVKVVQVDSLTALKSSTTYTYDNYDYPISTSIDRTGGEGGMLKESQSIEYLHNPTITNYYLGAIVSDTRIKTIPQRYVMSDPIIDNGHILKPLIPVDPIFPIDTNLVILPNPPDKELIPASHWVEKQVFTYDDNLLPVSRIDYVGSSVSELNKTLETCWTYDSYGNILTELYAPYNVTEFIGKTYTYDNTGINLFSVTNELGQITSFSNYDKFGKALTITDYKSRVTTDEYDDWGRLQSRIEPDGTISSTSYAWGGIGCYTVTKTVTGKPDNIIHYDAAGREVRSGSKRFDDQWIFTDTIYGRNGQVQKVSLPFKSSGSATLWNTYEYDEYLRPISYSQASGNITTWAYAGKSTTESKDGVWSIKTVNSNGQVVNVQDAGGTIDYTLRPDGQPLKVSVTRGQSTTFEYDAYGRRKKIDDPSAGVQTDVITYLSDGSSVATHTNPNGTIITNRDKYGRTTSVNRLGEYTTDYVYDSDGLLISETSSNGTSKTYTYDTYDRIHSVQETVPDGKWLKKTFAYTAGSNVSAIGYSTQSGFITSETFTYTNGTNVRISHMLNTIRSIISENEFGQPTSVTTGGITRTYSYTPYGLPSRRTMGTVMDYSYVFDPIKGNLESRTDNLRNTTEEFGYDDLNRLVSIDDRLISYSLNGNITSIDGVGDMAYENDAKPYQVTSLTLEDNIVPSRVQNVTYTCYSRPSIMVEGGRSAAFTYNADGERVKMNVSDGATSVLTRYYIGNQYEIDETPSGTIQRLYLGGDAYSAPMVYVKEGTGSWTLYNIGRDYLGNITHIATSNGTLVEENSYDPWGRLRNPETKEIYSLGTEPELMLGRGYTGHEHLTWFGLINMNARLYDPVLGRFLSPDPFVQMPDFTQNFNRYSYCLNNPLVYVDENGEFCVTTMLIVGGICAAVFGAGNLAAHAIRGDDLGQGNWAKYFFSGALAGFAVGSVGYAAFAGASAMASSSIGLVRGLGKTAAFGMKWLPTATTGVNFLGSAANGIFNQNDQWFNNFAKSIIGNFYLDENKSFWGQLGEGISRFTWEYPQQMLGYGWTSIRNIWSDRVDYYGGATFLTNEYGKSYNGVSLGSHINIDIKDSITGSFDSRVLMDPLFMHEYGHTVDSKIFGLLYLGVIGASSGTALLVYGPSKKYDSFWTEKRANRFASKYFMKNGGVDWINDPYLRNPSNKIIDEYPL